MPVGNGFLNGWKRPLLCRPACSTVMDRRKVKSMSSALELISQLERRALTH